MAKTLYESLGVHPSASSVQLNTAMRKITRDLQNSNIRQDQETLRIAQKAFAILADPEKRIIYDRRLAKHKSNEKPPNIAFNPLHFMPKPLILLGIISIIAVVFL
jgi:DnaJ-class molecular chaperone